MELEQKPPRRPNFPAVVATFAVAILVIFALALIFLRLDRNHFKFGGSHAKPSSTMLLTPPSFTQDA